MSRDPDQTKWQNILWREWRNCQNTSYAEQLFELVADTPVGWGARLTFMLLDMIIGMMLGLLLGFIFTTEWSILRQLVIAGGVIGAFRGFLASQQLFWRSWLSRLAFGLPTEQPKSGLLLSLLFLLLASLIFGPLLWLLLIGLFWGMSGLIQWMSKELLATNIFTYHAWYVWWPVRPRLDEVEAALKWASDQGLPYPRPFRSNNPLDIPPPPVEIDFRALKSQARNRETPPS